MLYRERVLEKAPNYKNLVPQMAKEIYSAFSFVYNLKIKKANPTHKNEEVLPKLHTRCYVENFMTVSVGNGLSFLVSEDDLK